MYDCMCGTIQQYFCHLQAAQSCSIPLSHHLEIEWTKYGSLVNPQPQIVSVKEVIQTNTTSLVTVTFSQLLVPEKSKDAMDIQSSISTVSVPHCSTGPVVWRQQLPVNQKLGGLQTSVCCCSSWFQSYTHHQRQTTFRLLLSFCLIQQLP